MARPDCSIDGRILAAARKEFLARGYLNASLRDICKEAGVTTGALYNRYAGKDELFTAVVQPFLDTVDQLFISEESASLERIGADDANTLFHASTEEIQGYMRLFYANLEDFRLLLCFADGSPYEDFLHKLIERETNTTVKVMRAAHERGLCTRLPEWEELHMLLTAYYSAILEPVIHNWPLEKALSACESISLLFDWRRVFGA